MKLKLTISALFALGVLLAGIYLRHESWKRIAFDSVRANDTRRLSDALSHIDVNATQKGANILDDLSLLNVAVVESTPEVVKLLLEKGANPNDAQAYDRLTPLHRAVFYHRENPSAAVIIEMLLESGADPSLKTLSGHRAVDLVSKGDRAGELLQLWTDRQSKGRIAERLDSQVNEESEASGR